jgi:S1-C subfamily serine protease
VRGVMAVGMIVAIVSLAGVAVVGAVEPSDAVFLLQVVAQDGRQYRSVMYGTAFFVSGDGTALTNSHVVYLAQREPARYRLLAVVNQEFFSASIVCASRLQHDPTDPVALNVRPGRDVAKIRLSPATFPFEEWRLALPGGVSSARVTAHRHGLPRFPFLRVGGHPASGDQVHMIGFGQLLPGVPRWTATGQVLSVDQTGDGTEIFGIDFAGLAQPGNSGSPVLNPRDEVIGMWTWHSLTDSNVAMAIGNSALRIPCL